MREPIDHLVPENVWLTAEQIAATEVIGAGKTVKSVRQYIFRHKLSNHPTLCRKAPGQGRALEYNLLLFAPRNIDIRKIGRLAKDHHPPRETAILATAEGGELLREIFLHVSMGRGPFEAEFVRNHCLDRFGPTIMKATDPTDRTKMLPLRAFRRIMEQLSSGVATPEVDVKRLMETNDLRGKSKDELIGLIEQQEQRQKGLRAAIMTVLKGAKATRDPVALRRRIDRIERLLTGQEGI